MAREATSKLDADLGSVQKAMLGAAGLVALLSASCCILPVGLSILGLGGAWLSILGVFVAWRSPILIVVGGVVIWSWVRLYIRPVCGRRRTGAILLASVATLAFLVAASAPLWEADAQRYMWALWRETRS